MWNSSFVTPCMNSWHTGTQVHRYIGVYRYFHAQPKRNARVAPWLDTPWTSQNRFSFLSLLSLSLSFYLPLFCFCWLASLPFSLFVSIMGRRRREDGKGQQTRKKTGVSFVSLARLSPCVIELQTFFFLSDRASGKSIYQLIQQSSSFSHLLRAVHKQEEID